jgi:hypothetical protein
MAPRFLTLDFNAPPAARRVRLVVLGLGVVALLAGGAELGMSWLEREQARAELALLDQRRPNRAPGLRSATVDGAALRVAASIARDLRAPWPELMRLMEANQSNDIALLQIEPVVARDTIRITADARHAEAMLDYLTQLTAGGLAEVALTSHQLRTQEPGTPIRFQVQARWTNLAARPNAVAASSPASPAPPSEPGSDLSALQQFVGQDRESR